MFRVAPMTIPTEFHKYYQNLAGFGLNRFCGWLEVQLFEAKGSEYFIGKNFIFLGRWYCGYGKQPIIFQ